MPAKKKEPKPTQVEGFRTDDYEGHELFTCERSKCEFNTFDAEAADQHRAEHGTTDEATEARADLTENLADRAQVTTEDEDG